MEAVTNLTEAGHSTREIAEILGASHMTVARDVTKVTARDKRKKAYAAQIEAGCTVGGSLGIPQ
jgi:DNA-binding CsgD family transcriptional regulator